MRIAIVGGGPAGLTFAILMARSHPDAAVAVHERNRLEDTFGFGVRLLRPDARQPRGGGSGDLRRHRRRVRPLGRHRDPPQGHRAPHRRQRVLRLRAHHAAGGPGRARGLARRRSAVRGRGRLGRGADGDARPRGGLGRHQLGHARAPRRAPSARRWTCAPTASSGWARPARSTPSPSPSRRPPTASSSRTPTSTSTAPGARAARLGSSSAPTRPSMPPASTGSRRRSPRAPWRRCSPSTSRVTGSSPTARSGAASR